MDSVIHALVGIVTGGVASFFLPGTLDLRVSVGMGVGLAAFGLARELYQHWDDRPRLTLHRWIEGLAWGVGGAVGAIL